MIVVLTNQKNLESKLKSILDTAKLRETNNIVIMTERAWHMEVFHFFLHHKAIGRVKVGDSTYFLIKEMRIELKPIDYYV
jgi:hypothetical protein